MNESSPWAINKEQRASNITLLRKHLTSLRALAGISQEDLACFLGISRQSYSMYETAKKEMPWTLYLALILFFTTNSNTKEMISELSIYPNGLYERFEQL